MSRANNPSERLYTVGGTVQAGGGVYIRREADSQLLRYCHEGAFAYVFSTRQVGKSSLLVSTADALRREGSHPVYVDLTQIGVNVTAEQWYLGLAALIQDRLRLKADVREWWLSHPETGLPQRLLHFLQTVCLSEIGEKITVFIDEIDSTLKLPFSDDFFAVIRSVYNARPQMPEFRRLSFVLAGVTTPGDLVKDPRLTPFNVGKPVELTDFTVEEAAPLAAGLGPPSQVEAIRVLEGILKWTGGHPYLTQRLCRAVADLSRSRWTERDVDDVVARTFLASEGGDDVNLSFVRDMLTRRAPDPVRILNAYLKVYREKSGVPDNNSETYEHLKLSGVVRSERGWLRMRNLLYASVFDEEWVEECLRTFVQREVKPPASIPRPPVVGFVARRDERGRDIVELLGESLAPERNQLVALWGPGGSGKTTMAAEFVRQKADAFRGRVAWVSAIGRADFSLATLLDEIATRLGREDLRKFAPEPKAEYVSALISERPTLVVLDNFETIAEKEQQCCLDFFAHQAACPALITTRSLIIHDDVYNIPLHAMTLAEARDFLGRLIERTRRPSVFEKIDRDDLIRRCEANPLVLQWVVRQIDLAKQPQDVLNDLAQGEGDAAERVFTRSFNLPQLGDDGRAVLLALALFTPDASREALAEVAGFGEDLRRLSKSVEALSSLWLVETTGRNERILLRGLTRELAKSQLPRDVRAEEFRRRFVAYFLDYARAYQEPTPEGYDSLEAEKDNLIGAADVALSSGAREGGIWLAYFLTRPVYGMLYLRGYWDEAVRLAAQSLRVARSAHEEPVVAYLSSNLAGMRAARGELEDARRLHSESLEIYKKLGDVRGVASTLHALGQLAHEEERFNEAQRLYSESLEISQALGMKGGIAANLHNLASLSQELGDLAQARRLYEQSLDIEETLGSQHGVARTLRQLGNVAYLSNDFAGARALFHRSLEIHQKLGDQLGIAESLHGLGILGVAEGNKVEATRLLAEALIILEKLGSPNAEVARRNLALVQGESD